jgi:hypothetical protein
LAHHTSCQTDAPPQWITARSIISVSAVAALHGPKLPQMKERADEEFKL